MRSAVKVIEANHVYKVFGRRPSDGVKKLKAGRTRDQLRKSGQTAAVIDTSFDVDKGEIFVVMGLSGSGKSTLIRMVNGLLPITAGSMTLYGEDLAHVSKSKLRELRRERVSMVFQNFALLPHRTVGENAAYGLEIQGVNRAERERRAEEALSLVGLEGWGGYKPGELHVGHCHGGTSRTLTFTEEGRTIPAGFGPSIGCRLLADREFVDKMRQMPALWNAIASGQVSLFWDMVFAPSGRLDDIRFTSTPITLPPAEMAALNQAITSA